MRAPLVSALAILALSLAAAPLAAQDVPAPGTRVRVEALGAIEQRWISGTVEESDSLMMVVASDRAGTVVVPVARITRLEVSRGVTSGTEGRRRSVVRGLTFGALLGAAMTPVYLVAKNVDVTDEDGDQRWRDIWGYIGKGALMGGAVGGGVGLALGSRPHEVWEPVTLPGRGPVISIAPNAIRVTIPVGRRPAASADARR